MGDAEWADGCMIACAAGSEGADPGRLHVEHYCDYVEKKRGFAGFFARKAPSLDTP